MPPTTRVVARVELNAEERTFASGLLLDLLSALRSTSAGDLIAITAPDPTAIETELDRWGRLTGHSIVARTIEPEGTRFVIRHGAQPMGDAEARPLGERLWLYVNFDCNLHCDYCCVRSSPVVPRRALGLERVQRIAREAPPLGVREFFVTGGEPFLLADIDAIVMSLAASLPVTLLTNGMLFRGSRLAALKRLPRAGVTLQISLDGPDSVLHDAHRGEGAWQRTIEGITIARAEGFRVRLAATVANDEDEERFRTFLDATHVAPQDRVVRRIALRGSATSGVALSRADLVPEITITVDGVYWHPVGAEDEDLLVTHEIFPLATAFDAARLILERERAHSDRVAHIFRCA